MFENTMFTGMDDAPLYYKKFYKKEINISRLFHHMYFERYSNVVL